MARLSIAFNVGFAYDLKATYSVFKHTVDETWATYILSPCRLSLKRADIKVELPRSFITFDVGIAREKKRKYHRHVCVHCGCNMGNLHIIAVLTCF